VATGALQIAGARRPGWRKALDSVPLHVFFLVAGFCGRCRDWLALDIAATGRSVYRVGWWTPSVIRSS